MLVKSQPTQPSEEKHAWHLLPLDTYWLIELLENCCSIVTLRVGIRYGLTAFYSLTTGSIFINTLRPRQYDRHFTDDILKCMFLNENVFISNKLSLMFVPTGPVNDIPTLVQIMAWRRPGDKPLSGSMMLAYWRIYVNTQRPIQNYYQYDFCINNTSICTQNNFDSTPKNVHCLLYDHAYIGQHHWLDDLLHWCTYASFGFEVLSQIIRIDHQIR